MTKRNPANFLCHSALDTESQKARVRLRVKPTMTRQNKSATSFFCHSVLDTESQKKKYEQSERKKRLRVKVSSASKASQAKSAKMRHSF